MKRLLGAAVILALAAGTCGFANQGKKGSALSELMQKKLKNAQLVLEGLALGDFAKITRSAETLIQITKTEEWQVVKNPRYEMHTNEFRRAAENLVQKARDKNLDGAAFAYVELTMTCVRCHQFVRDVRDVRLDTPPDMLGAAARR